LSVVSLISPIKPICHMGSSSQCSSFPFGFRLFCGFFALLDDFRL
jgi:hypothetical protein